MCRKVFATAFSITTFVEKLFCRRCGLVCKSKCSFQDLVHCGVWIGQLLQTFRGWWHHLRTFTSVTSRGFVKRKIEFYFEFLTFIILHYYHNPFGNEKKVFAHLPFIFFGHSDIHKAQPSYVCVFTFITLFALQLPAGHISLVGSEKEGVIKKQYISWSPFTDLLQFKIEKKKKQDKTNKKEKNNKHSN